MGKRSAKRSPGRKSLRSLRLRRPMLYPVELRAPEPGEISETGPRGKYAGDPTLRYQRHECSPECFARAFWANVDRSEYSPGGCWPWTGATFNGYGIFSHGGRVNIRAHREALSLAGRPVLAGLNSCHRCAYKACCNPDHLYAGTDADNARDRIVHRQSQGGVYRFSYEHSDFEGDGVETELAHPALTTPAPCPTCYGTGGSALFAGMCQRCGGTGIARGGLRFASSVRYEPDDLPDWYPRSFASLWPKDNRRRYLGFTRHPGTTVDYMPWRNYLESASSAPRDQGGTP